MNADKCRLKSGEGLFDADVLNDDAVVRNYSLSSRRRREERVGERRFLLDFPSLHSCLVGRESRNCRDSLERRYALNAFSPLRYS
jgi:hypothetical protein